MDDKETKLVKYLEELMARRGINKSQLATYAGVSHPTVLRWLKGTYVPSPKSCKKIAAYDHVSENMVMELAGHVTTRTGTQISQMRPPYSDLIRQLEYESPTEVPIVPKIHAGRGGFIATDYLYLPPGKARGRRLVAAPVVGNCMEPAIHENELVIVDLDASPRPGDAVVVLVDDEEVELRRLVSRTDGTLLLSCDNPAYPSKEFNEERIVGVVLGTSNWFRD